MPKFNIHPMVRNVLPQGTDIARLVQACCATKGEFNLVSSTDKESGVSIRGKVDRTASYSRSVREKFAATSGVGIVHEFIAFSDGLDKAMANARKAGLEVTFRAIPAKFDDWLAKFQVDKVKDGKDGNGKLEVNRLAALESNPIPA